MVPETASARFRRAGGLIGRFRLDGRLPRSTRRLLIDVVRARVAQLRGGLARSIPANGRLTVSFDELALGSAGHVHARLQEAGLEPFIVGVEGDVVQLGVLHDVRERAWNAIADRHGDERLVVQLVRGRRRRTMVLRADRMPRRAALATEWIFFDPRSFGTRVTGPESGVLLTFWHPGTSGLLERLGHREHERFDPAAPVTTERLGAHEFAGRSTFPVTSVAERFDEDVDVVITWVDGDDPEWRRSFERVANEVGRHSDTDAALHPARFTNHDELRFALRSIFFHCGWVRRIHLVTAGQRPAWLCETDRIRVVDHSEILPDEVLPTFSSHAIESALHRVPGLAEHFVYFNDDVFVGRPLSKQSFFAAGGLPYVFEGPARVPGIGGGRSIDAAAQRGSDVLLAALDRRPTFKPDHVPFPLRVGLLDEIETRFEDELAETRAARFRSPSDLSVPASFAQHYALATGRAVLGRMDVEYAHLASPRLSWHLARLLHLREMDVFCLNETEQAASDPGVADRLGAFLSAYFPEPAPWEQCARS